MNKTKAATPSHPYARPINYISPKDKAIRSRNRRQAIPLEEKPEITLAEFLVPGDRKIDRKIHAIFHEYKTTFTKSNSTAEFKTELVIPDRLPTKVSLFRDLPKRMIHDLPFRLGERAKAPVGPEIMQGWNTYLNCYNHGCQELQQEREVSSIFYQFEFPLHAVIGDVRPATGGVISKFEHSTQDRLTKVDTVIQFRSNDDNRILWESKSPTVFNRYGKIIVKKASATFSFDDIRGPGPLHNHEAILGKVSVVIFSWFLFLFFCFF
jgi:hypothetical protein